MNYNRSLLFVPRLLPTTTNNNVNDNDDYELGEEEDGARASRSLLLEIYLLL